MEVDSDFEMLGITEAAGRLLHPLDDGIDRLEAGVGDSMAQVGEQVEEVAANQLGHFDHRREATVGGPPVPAGEELPGGPGVAVLSEGAEPL